MKDKEELKELIRQFHEEGITVPFKDKDELFIAKAEDNTLYVHDFVKTDKGKILSMVATEKFEDQELLISAKIKISVTYIKDTNDLSGLCISKYELRKNGWIKVSEIKLSAFNLSTIESFLRLISIIDLKGLNQRVISLSEEGITIDDPDLKKKLTTLISTESGLRLIEEVLSTKDLSSADITNIGYRRNQLEIFERLLTDNAYVDLYKSQNSITSLGEEAAWQYFFSKNEWIFGYGLKYCYLNSITDQPDYGGRNFEGSGAQRGDYLMNSEATVKFTVLVEIKKPTTPLVKNELYRAGVWKLDPELLWDVSQIQVNCKTWET